MTGPFRARKLSGYCPHAIVHQDAPGLDYPGAMSRRSTSLLAFLRQRQEAATIAVFVLLVGLLLCFGWLSEEVVEGDASRFDQLVFSILRRTDNSGPIGPPWLQEFARDVTSLGSYAFLGFVGAALAGYLLLIHHRKDALLIAASIGGGMLISNFLKDLFERPRPDLPTSVKVFTASFPSGHATIAAVTFLTIGALIGRVHSEPRIRCYFAGIAVFLTVAVGTSRVYLGVHYASDVLAGWIVGGAWALACWALSLAWRPE